MYRICQSKNRTIGGTTPTHIHQESIEKLCSRAFHDYLNENLDKNAYVLKYKSISNNLLKSIKHLPSRLEKLSCSQSWLCFWILNSLAILGVSLPPKVRNQAIKFIIDDSYDPQSGGFGGGNGQLGHVASSYAAINTLSLLHALDHVDKQKMKNFLLSLKLPDGSFCLQQDGEVDIRASYCALSIAQSLDILDPQLTEGVAEYILQCQTYEGGFGAVPQAEAHGSYSFCAIAGLTIIGEEGKCDLPSLLRWLSRRQMCFEGGFNGRPNKLVDTCYSFWVGAAHVLTRRALGGGGLFSCAGLSQYLVCCGQTGDGLRDKPGTVADLYHTMYGLAGLSLCYSEGEYSLPRIVDGDDVIRILNSVNPLNAVAIENLTLF